MADTAASAEDADGYLVKDVQFGLMHVRIVTQEGDGPCPLIAVCNALLLRGVITLPHAEHWVSHGTLVRLLRTYALQLHSASRSQPDSANTEANVRDGLRVLESSAMRRGMLINPSLSDVAGFEFTPEIGVFDLFRVRPFHGWVVDPRHDAAELVHFFKGRSYNRAQDAITATLHDARACELASLASAWFVQHDTQLTEHGVRELERAVAENEVAVLFRNNHFATMIRHEGHLYTLISASAFWEHARYVFRRVAVRGADLGVYDGAFNQIA